MEGAIVIDDYVIFGRYRGVIEEIDSADSLRVARYLANEYRIAYGAEWVITIRRRKVA